MLFSCSPAGAHAGAARRAVARRGKRRLVIDLHCHCKTPAVEPLAAPHYAVEREPMDRFSNDRTREVNRQQGVRIAPQLTSVEQRIKDMDRMGVDVQAVSTSPLQFHYWTPPEVGREICRLVNENIAGMAARHPDRFVGLAHVPMQDPQAAAAFRFANRAMALQRTRSLYAAAVRRGKVFGCQRSGLTELDLLALPSGEHPVDHTAVEMDSVLLLVKGHAACPGTGGEALPAGAGKK